MSVSHLGLKSHAQTLTCPKRKSKASMISSAHLQNASPPWYHLHPSHQVKETPGPLKDCGSATPDPVRAAEVAFTDNAAQYFSLMHWSICQAHHCLLVLNHCLRRLQRRPAPAEQLFARIDS